VQSYLNVIVRDREDATVLAVAGELDMVSSPRLEDAITSLTAVNHRLIVLDLAELEFVDICGTRALVQARAWAGGMGARLVLINVSRDIRRVLSLTGAEDLLGLIEDSAA
jgi:anti-sigma B factor antagonist